MAFKLGARQLVLAFSMAVALALAAAGAVPAAARSDQDRNSLTVMTRNMDTGTDFGYVFSAQTPLDVVVGSTFTYLEVVASNPVGRAGGVANEIQQTHPDVVALQEVTLWKVGANPGDPATIPTIDQLSALLDALKARGLHYTAEVTALNQTAEAPTLIGAPAPGQLGIDVSFVDRDVLLVRSDAGLQLSNRQTAHFTHALMLPPALGGGPLLRSWESIDVTRHHRTSRVIGTHLEAFDPAAQVGQAHEIALGPAITDLPVILAGDMNTGPGTEVLGYNQLLSDGFVDTWPSTGDGPGLTNPLHNEDPLPPGSLIVDTAPFQRIDLILTMGRARPQETILTGASPSDKIPSGQWPSDHAGVVSEISVKGKSSDR